MCIAILNTEGKLSKKTIKNCWQSNGDGAGLAYVEQGKVKIHKEMKSVDKLYQFYSKLRDENKGNIILHFRIATHGRVDETNCHPFRVNDRLAFIHNGIISQTSKVKSDFSDTYHFNEDILKKLPHNFLSSVGIRELLADYISHSKLVFLDGSDNAYIINEQFGHWDGGNWYSNSSYKDKTYDSNPLTNGLGSKSKTKTKSYGYNYGYSYDYGYDAWDTEYETKPTKEKTFGDDECACDFCGTYDNVLWRKNLGGNLCKICKEEFEYYDKF
jgi:hypothetical protein